LTSLSNVHGSFTIEGCNSLPSLDGLVGITSIGDDLSIRFNPGLSNLFAFEGLTNIGGDLTIRSNIALSSLSGLDNVDAGSINNLTIYSNTVLSTCEVLSVCEYLVSPGGDVTITNNATGCDSPAEVEEACAWVSVSEPGMLLEVDIYPNPANSSITITLPYVPSNNTWLMFSTVNGQEVIRQQIIEVETGIDINHLKAGIYIVKIQTGRDAITRKLIVF